MPDSRKSNNGRSRLFPTEEHSAGRKQWHVFYLRPRAESRVHRILTSLNYEVFWPVIRSVRIWKNRQKKEVRLPLFPDYVFVYTYAHELYSIKCLPQVVNYVTCCGKPSTLSEREIEGLRQVLGLGRPITVETEFSKGERVRIASGPLKGYEGVLVGRRSKTRFGIRLTAINHTVLIDVVRSELEKL